MSPATAIPATHLRSQIHYHLDTDLPESANFLAGRLHALEPRNPDSHHLLALTYLRLRRFKAAFDYSHKYGANGRHLGCAYVFAQACLQLSRWSDGVTALEKAKPHWNGKSHWGRCSETRRVHLPDAAACWQLMGRLWKGHGDARKAGDCFIEAHKVNPFLWDAFDGLCKVGADLKVENMFRPTTEMVGSGEHTATANGTGSAEIYTDENIAVVQEPAKPLAPQLNFNQQVFTPSADPFNSTVATRAGPEAGAQFCLPNMKDKSSLHMPHGMKAPTSDWDTPTANSGIGVFDEETAKTVETQQQQPPAAPARRVRLGQRDAEVGDRPRQPALRTQAPEPIDDSTHLQVHQRKPSAGGHKRTISGQQPAQTSVTDSQPPRRSNRLFGQSTSTRSTSSRPGTAGTTSDASTNARTERPAKPATGTKGRIGSTVGRVVSGNRKMLPPDRNLSEKEREKRAPSRTAGEKNAPPVPTIQQLHAAQQQQLQPKPTQPIVLPAAAAQDNTQADQEALSGLLDHFRDLALATYSTTTFDTPLAIRKLRSLPASVRETPWVLAQLGRAYYEGGEHRAAEDSFARVLKLQPSRIQDMEVYSTVLWHLKKEAALAFLCYQLKDIDSNAPETWVAAGNAFSLSREHDQAIQAFKRAVQVDENFAYAWTLMGHEYIANEDFDAAISCFRKAVAVDRRGYGGWYGLGKSYERMGKLEESERHYRIASSINPTNATLLVCIGVILERLRNKKGALANYSRALELSPGSALARFKKARVLMHLRCYTEALVELEVLRDLAPDEANVWFLLGKCYKGLGERGEALRALTTALNLDVKAAPFIKEAMEALDEDGEVESDDE